MSNCVITNLDTVTISADRFGDLIQKEADLDRLLGFLLDGLYADKDYSDKNHPVIYFSSDPSVPRALRLLFPEDYAAREEELFTKWYNKRAEAKNAAEAE